MVIVVKASPPETALGPKTSIVEPLPSWPMSFPPQQNTAPAVAWPQLYATPALTAASVWFATVVIPALPPTLPLVAVIEADPWPTAVINPVADTTATAGLFEAQVKVALVSTVPVAL